MNTHIIVLVIVLVIVFVLIFVLAFKIKKRKNIGKEHFSNTSEFSFPSFSFKEIISNLNSILKQSNEDALEPILRRNKLNIDYDRQFNLKYLKFLPSIVPYSVVPNNVSNVEIALKNLNSGNSDFALIQGIELYDLFGIGVGRPNPNIKLVCDINRIFLNILAPEILKIFTVSDLKTYIEHTGELGEDGTPRKKLTIAIERGNTVSMAKILFDEYQIDTTKCNVLTLPIGDIVDRYNADIDCIIYLCPHPEENIVKIIDKTTTIFIDVDKDMNIKSTYKNYLSAVDIDNLYLDNLFSKFYNKLFINRDRFAIRTLITRNMLITNKFIEPEKIKNVITNLYNNLPRLNVYWKPFYEYISPYDLLPVFISIDIEQNVKEFYVNQGHITSIPSKLCLMYKTKCTEKLITDKLVPNVIF